MYVCFQVDVTCLGVGMYQKDLSAGQVSQVLGDVLSDCVGTVGVDLNTASVQLLRKVPGLNSARSVRLGTRRRQQAIHSPAGRRLFGFRTNWNGLIVQCHFKCIDSHCT